jgi:glucose/arabinose dehydrogenase
VRRLLLAVAATGLLWPVACASGRRLVAVRLGTFDTPVHAARPPGDRVRLFVVEQSGRIMVLKRGRKLRTPFLDIRTKVRSGGEQGLLSMAFDPDYEKNGLFYVDYTDNAGDTRIVAYRRSRRNPDRADPARRRLVLFQRQPQENHNGGLLLFGPDRRLYVGFGDGGGQGDMHGARGNGQNRDTLLGKILRIDPRKGRTRGYRIPADNPWAGAAPGRGEIWAYGLRNPWRFSFDRATKAMIIGDVGGNEWEEIDYARFGVSKGANWGWRPWEGPVRMTGEPAPGARKPVIAYRHDGSICAVTGGFVIRDRALGGLYGTYVYGDFCEGRLRAATLRTGKATHRRYLGVRIPQLASFAEGASGRIYVVSAGGGVFRLALR